MEKEQAVIAKVDATTIRKTVVQPDLVIDISLKDMYSQQAFYKGKYDDVTAQIAEAESLGVVQEVQAEPVEATVDNTLADQQQVVG